MEKRYRQEIVVTFLALNKILLGSKQQANLLLHNQVLSVATKADSYLETKFYNNKCLCRCSLIDLC